MKIGMWNNKKVTSLNMINSKGSNPIKKIEDFQNINMVVCQIWKDNSLAIFDDTTSWYIIDLLVNKKNKKIMNYIRRVGNIFDINIFLKFDKIKRINPNNINHIMLRDNCNIKTAIALVDDYKSKTSGSKSNFIKRHGFVEGNKRFGEFKEASKHTEQQFIEKYGNVLGIEKYQIYLSKKDSNSIHFFIKKYGETIGKIKFENNKSSKQYLSSKEYYIIKYGNEIGLKMYFDISKSKGRDKDYYIDKYGIDYYLEKILKPKLSYLGQEYVIPFKDQSDFQEYSRKVRRLTEKQKLYEINGINTRGKKFHLDHKFSVANGFLNNIPIYIIADISNLEIIPAQENLTKHATNSIELVELYNRYKIRK